MSKDGGPAFPTGDTQSRFVGTGNCPGMSLRDYFAAAALQAHIAGGQFNGELAAVSSYKFADAMLAERDK